MPGHLKVGPAVAAIIDRFLDQNTDVENTLLQAIGKKDADHSYFEQMLHPLRQDIAAQLAPGGDTDLRPIHNESCQTDIMFFFEVKF